MTKIFVNLLCAFVPSRKMRHKIRRKLIGKNSKSLDNLFWGIRDLQFHTTARLIATAELHKQTFAGFRNKFAGKTVVLVGAGPSVNKFKPIKNAI